MPIDLLVRRKNRTPESSKEILDTATAAGANFLITKPFTPDDVQASLTPFVGA